MIESQPPPFSHASRRSEAEPRQEIYPYNFQNLYASLKQWRILHAVVECGGYAKAAEALHISQSTLSYTINKLQEQLGVQIFKLEGRKAILTPIGKSLLARSKQVLKEAIELEHFARTLAKDQGTAKKEVHLVFDHNFPASLIWQALRNFTYQDSSAPDISLIEVPMLHIEDYMENFDFDLAISMVVPHGCLGEPLLPVEYLAVAHPKHDLSASGREISERELREHIQILITHSKNSFEWTSSSSLPCWKMNSFDTALAAVLECHGYAWLPEHKVRPYLDAGSLQRLNIKNMQKRKQMMYLIHNQASQFYGVSHSFIEALRQIAKNVFVSNKKAH